MKKQITTVLVFVLAAMLMCSCKKEPAVNTNTPPAQSDNIGVNYIFKSNSKLTLVGSATLGSDKISEDGIDRDNPDYNPKYAAVASTLRDALSESDADLDFMYANDNAQKAQHEVILGRCNRVVSNQAYHELEKMPVNEGMARFVIYSNGASVAIAYDDGDYDAAKIAVNYFIDNYVAGRDSLTLNVGYKYSENVDMIAYYDELGKEEIAAQWKTLEEDILIKYTAYYADDKAKAEKLCADTIKALKDFYASYDKDALVSWFANLYEPEICICNAVEGLGECQGTPYCGGAGFYFSNSGRDTLGFMPDLESTAQIFGFLKNSGMLDSVDGDVSAAFPEGEVAKIVAWVKSLQDSEDGYFYHPQWSKQQTQANYARMGRDLSHAVSILKTFGEQPVYDTPSGVSGSDSTLPTSALRPSENNLTGRLKNASALVAASKVIAVAETSVPSFLASKTAFEKYLGAFNIRLNSYLVANEISSISDQIKARDKELAAAGAGYSLTDILMKWFAENQNPDTGTWHWGSEDDPYYANNGVLKIITTYQNLGREFPNGVKAINNAINALVCDTPINHVCDLYNTWFTVSFICANLRQYGNKDAANEVLWALREKAPAAINATTKKMAACKCEDGSYSYHPGVTSTTSQGLPVAAPTGAGESVKGDVNATVICTYGNINYMFDALGFSGAPSICTESDRIRFKNLVSEFDQVIKNDEIDPYDPNTFEQFNDGDTVTDYNFKPGTAGAGSFIAAKEYPHGDYEGNVMQFHSGYGSWDFFEIGTKTGVGGDAFVFETDICFDEPTILNSQGYPEVPESGYLMQLLLGSGQNAAKGFYGVTAKLSDGEIYLFDMSSTKDGDTSSQYTELYSGLKFGEWIHIKIEFFRIDDYTTRAKTYVGSTAEDMVLVRVSDNYFDFYANKIDNPSNTAPTIGVYASSMISSNTKFNHDIYFDNLCIYRSRTNYKMEELPLDKNVDGPAQEEVRYNFADLAKLPDSFEVESADGTVGIDSGYLSLAGGAKFILPANYRTPGANVASFSADLLWNGGSVGSNLLSLLFTEGDVNVMNVLGLDFKVKNIGGVDYLVLHERQPKGTSGNAVNSIRIASGVETNITIDFYHTENVALLYIGGEFITSTDAVYENTKPRLIDSVTVESDSGGIMIDNLVFERYAFDFAEAVEPETPSNVYEFNSSDEETANGALLTGVTVKDGYASLVNSKSSILVPIEVRSPVISAHLVKFTVIPGEDKEFDVRLAIVDADGNIIVAVDAVIEETVDGTSVKLYEVGKAGRYSLMIGSKMVPYGQEAELSLIWHPSDLTANIEVSGTAVAHTSVFFDNGSEKLVPAYGAAYNPSSDKFYLDNMIAESLYKYRTPVVLSGENPENNSDKLTYESSVATNIPKAITLSLESGGSCVRVEQALKKIGEASAEYSKALVLQSNKGGNDRFTFKPSKTTSGQSRVMFETEMMVSSKSDKSTYLFQLMFTDPSWQTRDITYMPTIGIIGDKVVMTDFSVTGGNSATNKRYENNFIELGAVDEWFKLSIEYYQGDKDSVRIVIKVNGGEEVNILKNLGSGKTEVIGSARVIVSDNYYGYLSESAPDATPRNDIKELLFYGQTGVNAVIYLDNTRFFGDAATCVYDEVNLVKYLK